MAAVLERDLFGAFVRETHAELDGAPAGPLAGFGFAVKDVYDIAGQRTGFGSPDWLRTHEPAQRTAPAVQTLVDAGARMIGKTHTDELTYSLNGENAHYGTPVNPKAPGRIPGGSSSGSAVAVAAGLCDFSLGSDTGGSVRIPASYCGVFGMRPSHGRIALDGARPLAPSFDTAGWFARDAAMLERVGKVLLREHGTAPVAARVLIARDAFALAGDAVSTALQGAAQRIAAAVARSDDVVVSREGLASWMECFRTLQAAEVWAAHGEWVRLARPRLGPGIKERFEMASKITPDQVAAARRKREQVAARMNELLPKGTLLCMPTAPGIAPLRDTPPAELDEFRARALSLLCIAGLARLPQISLPLGTLDGCPLGLSLVAGHGQDGSVLAFARTVAVDACA